MNSKPESNLSNTNNQNKTETEPVMLEGVASNEAYNNLSDSDADERFEMLCADLSKSSPTLSIQWADKLLDRVDNEEISIQEACCKIEEVINSRKNLGGSAKIEKGKNSAIYEKLRDDMHIIDEVILLSESMPPNFLGNGAVAEVYQLANRKGVCAKIVKDFDKYKEGNTIHQEAKFLEKLNGFEVDGVRSPELVCTVSTINTYAILMEELDAVNFRRVLEGHDKLPESFDFNTYFSKLRNYLNNLHEKGIYHQDFVLRNMMIDNKTGDPYVIDFGKAENKDDLMGERFHELEPIKISKDMAGLESAIAEVKQEILNTN